MKHFVYYNFHKKLWSVKALSGEFRDKVILHANSITLENCEFSVNEAGRQRVLRDQRKNVHAGVIGTVSSFEGQFRYPTTIKIQSSRYIIENIIPLHYNPYKGPHFIANNKPIHQSRCAYFSRDRKAYVSDDKYLYESKA